MQSFRSRGERCLEIQAGGLETTQIKGYVNALQKNKIPFAREARYFRRLVKTSHMSKGHNSQHLPRNQTVPKTATMSKALRQPRNLHIPSDLLCLPRKVDFGPPERGLPATKSDYQVRKRARFQSRRAPCQPPCGFLG